jgi:hypothetical protein
MRSRRDSTGCASSAGWTNADPRAKLYLLAEPEIYGWNDFVFIRKMRNIIN